MKFRNTAKAAEAEIDLAPMIDVVFLLLIFFIVTWNFARFETELDVSVPVADEGADPQRTVGEIIVNIRQDGTIVVNAVELSEDELFERLSAVSEVYKDQAVILRGDREASYADIINALDVIQRANIWNVAFATNRPTTAPPSSE
ncbi:MAG: biopolymer transporter ExbD [Verrucomicrobiota bacterium]